MTDTEWGKPMPVGHGGARKGAGRKAEDGASGLVPHSIALQPELKAWCQEVGAARIRQILQEARQSSTLA